MKRIKGLVDRRKEVEFLMSQPKNIQDPNTIKKLGREYHQSEKIVTLWEQYEKLNRELDSVREFALNEPDVEIAQLAKSEEAEIHDSIKSFEEKIQSALLPQDITESADAIMEIRAGTGGEEASLFAGELYRMYLRFAELKGWKASEISYNDTGLGGIKEVVFEVSGDGTYSTLKLESGVHRVQRIPSTESQGRLHTSAVTVAVLPKAEDIDIKIEDSDIRTDVFHASGAGGQNVNKVATAIRITHISSGIVVTCQNQRSQLQNRIKALEILRSRLWIARLREKQENVAKDRRSQVGGGDRSEKIRTYNFHHNRVTDHRINQTFYNLHKVLDGELDEFLDILKAYEQARKISVFKE